LGRPLGNPGLFPNPGGFPTLEIFLGDIPPSGANPLPGRDGAPPPHIFQKNWGLGLFKKFCAPKNLPKGKNPSGGGD